MLAYLGSPVLIDDLLFAADVSLVRQATEPRMMALLNLGGFGLAAWDQDSPDPARPFTYRTAGVPTFDRNLKSLASKVHASALLAHVRGVIYDPGERVGVQQTHPFLFDGAAFALAMNGDLFDFARMRYDLLEHIPPALSSRIEGTTDSEWFYALVLAQLDDPFAPCTAWEMAAAARQALGIVREVRERRGIDTQSPINLVLSDGQSLVATRLVFDYGWYPQDGSFFAAEREHDYTTLYYATAISNGWRNQDGRAAPGGPTSSLVVASEPLTADRSTWARAPEYSILIASPKDDGGLSIEIQELEL
ncbi:MAG TPA: class II glutamine amidotransferase [Solirubrobacteraceae bacterium]|nr:class II glutamine amidotransferase [Solirubrobacteraceae bacterium]